jgi:cytochrome c5
MEKNKIIPRVPGHGFRAILMAFCLALTALFQMEPGSDLMAQNGKRPNAVSAQPLQFDALEKSVETKPGDKESRFSFIARNTTNEPVTIEEVQTSCGCTSVVKKSPWVVQPGESDTIQVSMDLLGRQGTVTKSVYVFTNKGVQTLKVVTMIPAGQIPHAQESTPALLSDRQRNQLKALRDRQIVFRGDCARCHAKPTEGLAGEKLYGRACGICHNSPNRASMVPDLAQISKVKDKLYWEVWIKYGRKGSLMPAFHQSQGGPLDDNQVNSLVDFLLTEVPGGVMEIEPELTMESTEKPQSSPPVSPPGILLDSFDPLKPLPPLPSPK